MNLSTKQIQGYRCRKQTYGYQGVRWGEINWKTEIDIYTLLYIKQIISKVLLCSRENSTQYSVMAYMGKECEKEQIYVYLKKISGEY